MNPRRRRGTVLIASYLLLSVFLVYTNMLGLRTLSEQRVVDQLHDSAQALNLARGAAEQLREDLNYYLISVVNAQVVSNDTIQAMAWLDGLASGTTLPAFDLDDDGLPDGTAERPVTIEGLATIPPGASMDAAGAPLPPRSWITSVRKQDDPNNPGQPDPNPLAPRLVTIESEARIGMVTKHLRFVFEVALGPSNIFRYAYFLNNYGWFDLGSGFIQIDGEVRSNGDLRFSGNLGRTYVNGDLYASQNPAVFDPLDGDPLPDPSEGIITGDPNEDTSLGWYWGSKKRTTRPELRLTFPGQPTIGLTPTPYLPAGAGWDSEYPSADNPDQHRFERQQTQDIPYLGNLNMYKQLAAAFEGTGSTLSYVDQQSGQPVTIAGVSASTAPLVLVGTEDDPIEIHGPIVAGGDVIIKGYVTGRGTIYTGRNVHIVGDIYYEKPPRWPSVQRYEGTGQIRSVDGWHPDLGSVCSNGTYVPASAGAPESRCP